MEDLFDIEIDYTVKVGSELVNSSVYTIVPNVTTKTTLTINVDQNVDDASKVGSSNLDFINIFDQSTAYSENPDIEAITDFNQKSAEIVREAIFQI